MIGLLIAVFTFLSQLHRQLFQQIHTRTPYPPEELFMWWLDALFVLACPPGAIVFPPGRCIVRSSYLVPLWLAIGLFKVEFRLVGEFGRAFLAAT